MIDDLPDFSNTVRTLGCQRPGKGHEEEAYGAALGLIHWQMLTPMARDALARANIAASRVGQVGVSKTTKGAFFGDLNHLRLQVFGPAPNSIANQANLLNYPRSLTDREFQFCMLYIKTGNVPDPDKFEKRFLSKGASIAMKVAQDALVKKIKDYLEKGLITIGGAGVGLIFKIKGTTLGGAALDFVRDVLMERLKDLQKQDLISRYNIDEVRRIYLAAKSQSTYQKIANLS